MIEDVLNEILELDKKATPKPWLMSEDDEYDPYMVWAPNGVTDYDTANDDRPTNCIAKPPHESITTARNDMSLIADYRSAAPVMAKLLLDICKVLDETPEHEAVDEIKHLLGKR